MSREDILHALRDEFRANTRERLVEMSALLERVRETPDESKLRSLERHFHGLAGLGGTYGYQPVTVLAREGEVLCEQSMASPAAIDCDQLAAIMSALSGAIEHDPQSE
jgi:chemotaxis protein histidine kinase CheA